MSELTTLARPYAKAAFEFAQTADNLSAWSEMLSFCALAITDENLSEYLDNPGLTREQVADVMLQVAEGKLDEHGQNFVRLLSDNKRLDLLPAIARLFEENKAKYEKTVDVDITSAVEMSESQLNKVSERLSDQLGRKVNINSETDASLIGGMLIRAGDMVIDASVKGKLNELSDTLMIK